MWFGPFPSVPPDGGLPQRQITVSARPLLYQRVSHTRRRLQCPHAVGGNFIFSCCANKSPAPPSTRAKCSHRCTATPPPPQDGAPRCAFKRCPRRVPPAPRTLIGVTSCSPTSGVTSAAGPTITPCGCGSRAIAAARAPSSSHSMTLFSTCTRMESTAATCCCPTAPGTPRGSHHSLPPSLPTTTRRWLSAVATHQQADAPSFDAPRCDSPPALDTAQLAHLSRWSCRHLRDVF